MRIGTLHAPRQAHHSPSQAVNVLQAPLQTGAGGVLVRMLATLALTLTSALALTFASALAPLRPRSHAPPPSLAAGAYAHLPRPCVALRARRRPTAARHAPRRPLHPAAARRWRRWRRGGRARLSAGDAERDAACAAARELCARASLGGDESRPRDARRGTPPYPATPPLPCLSPLPRHLPLPCCTR